MAAASAQRKPKNTPGTTAYRRRQPEYSAVYQVVQGHLETWLSGCRHVDKDGFPVAAYIEQDFRKFLECGILAHGFARARCAGCGYNFLIAYSCKGRGICPSCNTRRMVETATHLVDEVFHKSRCASGCCRFPNGCGIF